MDFEFEGALSKDPKDRSTFDSKVTMLENFYKQGFMKSIVSIKHKAETILKLKI